MDFGMCKNCWIGPEYSHLNKEQYGKLDDDNLSKIIPEILTLLPEKDISY